MLYTVQRSFIIQRSELPLHAVIPEAVYDFLATETACILMISTLYSSIVALFLFPFNYDAANLTPLLFLRFHLNFNEPAAVTNQPVLLTSVVLNL